MSNRNVFERDPLERARIAEAFHGIENLNAGHTPLGIIVGSNAFTQMLGRNRSLFKADLKSIDVLVVGDPHAVHP
jgi:hypothetical protein